MLANGGMSCCSSERIFDTEAVKCVLSFMLMNGVFQLSGEWAFNIGLPAKSGISGNIYISIPGVGGLAIFSPAVDKYGNSVRACTVAKLLADRFPFHVLDSANNVKAINKKTKSGNEEDIKSGYTQQLNETLACDVGALCFMAREGDLPGMHAMAMRGIDMGDADYDGRTCLHVAASDGKVNIVKYLLSRGVPTDCCDRWGGTPLSNARTFGQTEVESLLLQHKALMETE